VQALATVRAEVPPPAPARANLLGVLPTRTASVGDAPAAPPSTQAAPPAPPSAQAAPVRNVAPERDTALASAVPSSRPQTRSGWVIQVGAYPAESEAQQRIALVKSKASRLLAAASPFTEPVQRGDTTLYRARFAGLDRDQAEAACKFLRRNDVDCLAMRN
jgi:D-alanyl-D-alanine carboxypeptidase